MTTNINKCHEKILLYFFLFLPLLVNAIEVVISPSQGGSAIYSGSYKSATYTAIPNNGYVFDHWELWDNCKTSLCWSVTNNQTPSLSSSIQGGGYKVNDETLPYYKLIAFFTEKEEITSVNCTVVNISPFGTISFTGEVIKNSAISLQATASECSKFVKWSDNNTTNPRTVKVTQDSTFTAIFEKVNFTITLDADAEKGKVIEE